jgi:predicted nucleic acid-binding protein
MIKEIALDTSIVIPIFRNDPDLATHFKTIENVYFPVPVIAEFYIGFIARKSSKEAQKAKDEFEVFVSRGSILDCNREAALKYAEIECSLRRDGALIPQNDIWIAACCLTAGVPLATRDNHFQRIPDLKVEMW